MSTIIVTRHAGAIAWLRMRGFEGETLATLDEAAIAALSPGDRVIGVLPLTLAIEVLGRGAEAYVIQFPARQGPRGTELSAEEMEAGGAQLLRFGLQARESCVSAVTQPGGSWEWVGSNPSPPLGMPYGADAVRARIALIPI